MLTPVRRALLSVSDKTGIVEFARELKERGIELLSTGGTAKLLVRHGISVKEVAEHTGFPEIMGGRVKTLHPKIHGGLLGRRGTDDAVMRDHDIEPIDLLAVNLYPFAATVARPDCTYEEAVENIDVGGPAMVRAAAKNHASVTVVVDPGDYRSLLDELAANQGATQIAMRQRLAAKAFAHTAQYDAMVSAYFTGAVGGGSQTFPEDLNLSFRKRSDLRYGENPHQQAAYYTDPRAIGASVTQARQIQGKELSYNNIADSDTALECVRQFDPAGMRHRETRKPLRRGARRNDRGRIRPRLSNRPDLRIRRHHRRQSRIGCRRGARHPGAAVRRGDPGPSVASAARALLAAKDEVRVLEVGEIGKPVTRLLEYKSVAGGLLVQTTDDATVRAEDLRVVTARAPTPAELDDLAVRLACREICQIQCHRLRQGHGHVGRGRRANEPRGQQQDRGPEGPGRGPVAEIGVRGVRRVLPVSRRTRRHRRVRHQIGHPARRIEARCGSDRRGERTRHRHGVHRDAPLSALAARVSATP